MPSWKGRAVRKILRSICTGRSGYSHPQPEDPMDYGEFRFARCRLCGDPVNNPRILCCWHVFCQDCIIGYNTEEEQVKCPVCKEVTPLPPEGIPGLQHRARGFLFRIGSQSPKIAEFTNNIYLRHYCPQRAKQVQDHRKCFVPATKRCIECDEYMCSLCSPNHLLEMHKAPPIVCGRHNKPEDFYCEDCNVVTCSRCAGTIHIHHDTCEMEEVATGFREVMEIWLDQWRQGRWQMEEDLEMSLLEVNTQIQMQSDRILDSIIDVLRQRELDLLNQVDKFARDMCIRFQDEKSKHSTENSHLKPLCDFSESLVRFGSDQEVIALHREITLQLESAVSEMEPTEVPDDLRREMFFEPGTLPNVAEWIQIGTVSVSPTDGFSRNSKLSITSRDSGHGSELSLESVGLPRSLSCESDIFIDEMSKSNKDLPGAAGEETSLHDGEKAKKGWKSLKHKMKKHSFKTSDKSRKLSSPTNSTEQLHELGNAGKEVETVKSARRGSRLSSSDLSLVSLGLVKSPTAEGSQGQEKGKNKWQHLRERMKLKSTDKHQRSLSNGSEEEESGGNAKKLVRSARKGSVFRKVVTMAVIQEKGNQEPAREEASGTSEHLDWRRHSTVGMSGLSYAMGQSPRVLDTLKNTRSRENARLNWRKAGSQTINVLRATTPLAKPDKKVHFDWRQNGNNQ
ncbi:uncharacterized protein LOC118403645 [Branchiostoma floridae]|uniref:Uncharacterized protein LOC118403645 n=1 Tax=Branchiostoma floridae TaxID=7739 RepID=A0A9J7KH21_BRAFL|nr:uncharacterized protein LOC118403645 [Branchiostoma floridae]